MSDQDKIFEPSPFLAGLLCPIPGDEPSGESMEYAPAYLELETLASGTHEIVMGDETIPATPPQWPKLRANCLELWKSTRDLRVAAYLTMALLALEGLSGLRDGMALVDYLVTNLWETVWPQLDPDDDNDPTERVNIVQMLSPEAGGFGDGLLFISHLRATKLDDKFPWTLRDLLIVNGQLDAGETKIDSALFNAEMTAVPVGRMAEKLNVVRNTEALLERIAGTMSEKTEGAGYVNFDSLRKDLKVLERFYAGHAQAAEETDEAEEAAGGEAAPEGAGSREAPRPAARRAVFDPAQYTPSTRAEALLLLKKSAEYFRGAEPTSPVPYLIDRALRMAEMNFLDLLAEIDENALSRGREQLGVPPPRDVY